MPTIISDPYSGNVFGRIGRGVAEGLSEQVPKEIRQQRLASSLSRLGKEEREMSPIDQGSELLRAGFNPQEIGQFLPLLQQQQANKVALEESGIRNRPIPGEKPLESRKIKPEIFEKETKPLDRLSSYNFMVETPTEELLSLGRENYQKNPARYGFDVKNAEREAAERDARRVSIDRQIHQRTETIENQFNKLLSQKLQKSGSQTYGDVLGDLQNDFVNKAIQDTGLSAREAANKYADEALDFAKKKQDLASMGGLWERVTSNPKKRRERLDSIRDSYAKNDKLEAFKDELVAKGMSQAYASYLAYPPKDNKDIAKYISSLPSAPKSVARKIFAAQSGENKEPQIAQQIAKRLKNSDSLFSIALELNQKGYDGEKFLSAMRKLSQEGKVSLTNEQDRVFSKNINLKPNLEDILIFANGGLDPLLGE